MKDSTTIKTTRRDGGRVSLFSVLLLLAAPSLASAQDQDPVGGPAFAPAENETDLPGEGTAEGASAKQPPSVSDPEQGEVDAPAAKQADVQGPPDPREPVTGINKPGHWLRVKGAVELGFLAVLYHKIQLSRSGSYFDYVGEGNQDNLFFFWRVSAELEIVGHHSLIFLYQPLDIATQAIMKRDVVVDDLTFPEGTPTSFRYGFDYYRFSYLYDFFGDPGRELSIGLSLQIRNATIVFKSEDGSLGRTRNNIGPVPIIKIRGRYTFKPGLWIGTEIDGFIASGKIITGSRKDFLGAILDASLRVGFDLTPYLETFINLRYVGGGAKGTSKQKDEPGDGYTKNWISLLSFSIGIGFK